MSEPILTQEIAPIPLRDENAHKGDVGRVVVIGGCDDGDLMMVGAPALVANAAFRSGAGLVQMFVPESLRSSVAVLTPCAITRTLPTQTEPLLKAIDDFQADVVAIGPGLGQSLDSATVVQCISELKIPVVVDADALNLIAQHKGNFRLDTSRCVFTPHPGEMKRLLAAKNSTQSEGSTPEARKQVACLLVEHYQATVILKGRHTVITNGERLYINETGNAGMATGGAGDILTGIVAALIGQKMEVLEASILGVYLHGLAGDFAAQELGRCSMTAMDLIEYLPEAFGEHEVTRSE